MPTSGYGLTTSSSSSFSSTGRSSRKWSVVKVAAHFTKLLAQSQAMLSRRLFDAGTPPDRIPTRWRLKPLPLAPVAALGACLLLAACGGSVSHHNEQAKQEASTEEKAEAGTAAYARCMRGHGVAVETSRNGRGAVVVGGFRTSPEGPVFQRAQNACKKLLPGRGLPGEGPPPSSQTFDRLVKIARCMRGHGISEFPDPTTTRPTDLPPGRYREITDYDGAILLFPRGLDLEAPAYRKALTACGAPPLGLPH